MNNTHHQDPHTTRIRELNDAARTCMGLLCRVYQTQGIQALDARDQSAIREKVELFKDFNPGNDPYGQHDFGSFEHNGHLIFWKFDYYDRNYEYGSEEPWNPQVTCRVLTIMLAQEY
jgi:Protein of unknown function (DUF3768)